MMEMQLPAPAAIADFQWLDLRRALEQEPRPLDFVIPGLKSGTVGSVVSPGATGKTMLAIQIASAIATGSDMLEFQGMDRTWNNLGGRVVYLSGEDPEDILQARIHNIGQLLNQEAREILYENLFIAPLVGRSADITNSKWRNWISGITRDARLVIIDTLRRFHQLDENDGGAMASLLSILERMCRENDTTILFLHHTNKSAALALNGDYQQASRGSSVLTDNVRFQANLVGMTTAEAERFGVDENLRRNFVRLTFPKLNYSAPIADKWYRRRDGGVLQAVEMSEPRVTKKGGNREQA